MLILSFASPTPDAISGLKFPDFPIVTWKESRWIHYIRNAIRGVGKTNSLVKDMSMVTRVINTAFKQVKTASENPYLLVITMSTN